MKIRVPVPMALVLGLVGVGVTACGKSEAPPPPAPPAQTAQPAPAATPEQPPPGRNPDRNAYFGEEHIHTSWSVDAWVIGNRLTGPDDALKYAQGATIKPPLGYDVKIDTPMDFIAVRVAGSWVAATGLLMLGWSLSGRG